MGSCQAPVGVCITLVAICRAPVDNDQNFEGDNIISVDGSRISVGEEPSVAVVEFQWWR